MPAYVGAGAVSTEPPATALLKPEEPPPNSRPLTTGTRVW